MGKPDDLTRRMGNEKSEAEERIFAPGQLMELVGYENKIVEDIEIEGIDYTNWDKDEARLLKVPENHINDILCQCHDSKIAGHWGRARTQELVSRNFTWHNWRKDVMHYVATCKACQMNKVDCHAKQMKSTPMLTGNRPFEEIAMDFVGELPESEGFNAILVITDRFTKVQYYIPAKTSWTAADVADAYICYIWKLYGLP